MRKLLLVLVSMVIFSVCWAEEVQLMSPRNQTEAYFRNFFGKVNYDYSISRCGPPTSVTQGADVYVVTWVRYLDDYKTMVGDRLHLTFRKSDNILVGCSYDKVERR